MGFTINMVVLFGLILSVGLLVDGAVVVVEYAQRKFQEGMGLADSYIKAASRMSLPIIASTLTTIAAFVPLLFWPGTTGGFMKYIPITVISVLGSSLAMALDCCANHRNSGLQNQKSILFLYYSNNFICNH